MEIEGYRAVIEFHPDIEMFRGEFVGLNGGADFYARGIPGLRREGAAFLKVFLDVCKEMRSSLESSSPASSMCVSRRIRARPLPPQPPSTARA